MAEAAGAGGGTNGTSCWQTVPSGGSVSVSICATTAVSMQSGEPFWYAVCPSPTIVRKRTLPSCVARRLAPRKGVAGSYVVATSSTVGADFDALNGPRNTSLAWIGQSA